ncbi:hypothetical protein AGMMS50218_10940 [Actinomycetota bacterium]|nr:hypothetical protein AGMMS50218_10940 [Actinomycetota bacterium]
MTAALETNHDDLMDLASRWSYDGSIEDWEWIPVNGTTFSVLDAVHDPVTGLDAFTFQNTDTLEVTVAFQGTQGRTDAMMDAALLLPGVPAQYEAAEAYVRRMQAKYGAVGSVCGNSLGGGLAAYVAALNPRMLAVTVNPAPVPAGMAGRPAPNVYNYISEADVLNRAMASANLGDRVLGHKVPFNGTRIAFDFLGKNHVGSDRKEGPYDASMAVPFSLFHANRVLSGGTYGPLVDITVDNLQLMVGGLQRQREDLLTVLAADLVGIEEELRGYAATLPARDDAVRRALRDLVEGEYASVRRAVGQLGDEIERVLRSPLVSFPSPPGPLRLAWLPVRTAALAAANELAGAVQQLQDFAAGDEADSVWRTWRALFLDQSEIMTEVLAAQSVTLQSDLGLVDTKWGRFQESADAVAEAVAQADEQAAAAIAARSSAPDAVPARVEPWPPGAVEPLQEDIVKHFDQTVAEVRAEVVGEVLAKLAASLAGALTTPVKLAPVLIVTMEAAEEILRVAQIALRAVALSAALSPVAIVTGKTDDLIRFQQRVRDLYADLRASSDEWQHAISEVSRTLDRLPEAVLSLEDYFRHTFFSDAQIETAYNAFLKCRNLVERSATAFGEVEHQLDEHSAAAIDALAEKAGNLRQDLATVSETLTEMVF